MSAKEAWSAVAPHEWSAIYQAYRNVIPLNGKEPAVEGWRELAASAADVTVWGRAGFNIGVRGGEVLFVDVDLDHDATELAAIIRDTVEAQLGKTLARTRPNSARFALVYFQPHDPVRAKWTIKVRGPDGSEVAKIELLSYGQQLLLAGLHPSGVLITYQGDPHASREALPRVERADMDRTIEALAGRLSAFGMTLHVRRAGETGDASTVSDPRHTASDFDRLADAVGTIPNEVIASRGEWVAIMHAIKGACAGDEAFFERVVMPWCLRWKGAAPNDVAAEARRVWDSIREVRFGADRLEAIARGYGYQGVPLRNDLIAFPVSGQEGDKTAPTAPVSRQEGDSDDWLDPPKPGAGGDPPSEARSDLSLPGMDDRATDDGAIARDFCRTRLSRNFLYDPFLGRAGLWRYYEGGLWHAVGTAGADQLRDVLSVWVSEQYGSKLVIRCDLIEKHLRAKRRTSPAAFDGDRTVIVRPDGVTVKGAEARHSPDHMATRMTPMKLGNPDNTRIFDHWLDGWSDGSPELARTMEELLARGFAPEPQGQYLFNLTGRTNNGKSLYCELARTVYGRAEQGGLCADAAPETFAVGKIHGSQHRTDLVALAGARLVLTVEPDTSTLDGELLKRMSGGDPVVMRLAHSDKVLSVRMGTLVIVSNHPLRFRKLDPAMERRLFVVPFNRTFAPDETVHGRMEREFRDHGPDILARLLRVAQQSRGSVFQPASVRTATQNMLDAIDQRRAVCRDAFVAGGVDRLTFGQIADAYKASADQLGVELDFMTDETLVRDIADTLIAMGARQDRWRDGKDRVRGWVGLRVRDWLD